MKRGMAKMRDLSFTAKKTGKKRRRYYIYISTPELVEDPEFPFTFEDKLLVSINKGKLIVEKM